MNRTKLKNYAPQARREFIQAMTDRAAFYGLTAKKIEPVVERGDVAVIAGREHPRAVAKKRKQLEDRIKQHGFEQTMEALAYTWFNRLVAVRFMELHGYLEHGYRVLSPAGSRQQAAGSEEDTAIRPLPSANSAPEVLVHAEHVELPGLNKGTVIDLKLAGNKEGELYRLLLTAQCNALHEAMPFLFERIGDETELVLPDNLLHSDSLIRKLVNEIDEEDWREVEIIGWLYQFYISEKKDEVIGKVVASEDIPAATQLFTPNWIVKYLVQNTLGRQWLATYPQSSLRGQMEYYIEPAEQTPEVQEQLKAITPTSLNPEELTLLDPACGSGHILVEAYDLFKAIYQERGYRAKDIPALILQKNLFGMEIDDRAAQLAAFALMMKARADDRRIFDSQAGPNILAFEDSQGMNAADITHALNSPINKDDVPKEYLFEEIDEEKAGLFSKKALAEKGHVSQGDIASLLALFENAKTFGSLIQIPPKLAAKLPEIERRLNDVLKHGDLIHNLAHVIRSLLQQARLLARQYDAVVANPPYMGSGNFNPTLRAGLEGRFKVTRTDLYAVFVERSVDFVIPNGYFAMITMQSWMFTSSYVALREKIIADYRIGTLAQLGARAFDSITGEIVATVMFCLQRLKPASSTAIYLRLTEGDAKDKEVRFHQPNNRFSFSQLEFKRVPGSPMIYWKGLLLAELYEQLPPVGNLALFREGIHTAANGLYLRRWWEIDLRRFGKHETSYDSIASHGVKWIPYNKGGGCVRWYGNYDYVIAFDRQSRDAMEKLKGHIRPSQSLYFKSGGTWSDIGTKGFGVKYYPSGFLFDAKGPVCVGKDIELLIAGLNSIPFTYLSELLMPTISYKCGTVKSIPFPRSLDKPSVENLSKVAIELARADWDNNETSWDFNDQPLLRSGPKGATLEDVRRNWETHCKAAARRMQEVEAENNRLFLEAYGLQNELSPEVPNDHITLYRPDRAEDIKRLLSYAIGCIMGRYSFDKAGLIYAHSGNQGFDSSQYKTFRADDDGIIPLLETDWGIRDAAANRIVEFVGVARPKEHLQENLKFIADSLGPSNNEQPLDTIRRYLATGFYKHHLSMYKKRPIYWLFSSGKQRAFQCLVYLHRYHEGTLARMRTEYLIPLQGQIASRIDQLEGDKAKATSTSHRNKLQKEQDNLKKQQAELITFEEKLKHAADQKISLDLDDGVKVNYGKFGDLLAESKAITGGKDDEG